MGLSIFNLGCSKPPGYPVGSFGYDKQILEDRFDDIVILSSPDSMKQIIVSGESQARVLTSTSGGLYSSSYGWLNHEYIIEGTTSDIFNAIGGEDRIWLGPEGSKFSLYFDQGVSQEMENWRVPNEFDSESFDLTLKDNFSAFYEKEFILKNYSGFEYEVRIERILSLLSEEEAERELGFLIDDDIAWVGFESENHIKNIGSEEWNEESGMPSLWLLGMFKVSEDNFVVIPYKEGTVKELGKVVNSDYFGTLDESRLQYSEESIFFKSDGNYRSKIGVSAKRSLPILASINRSDEVLTICQFSLDTMAENYVNSLWSDEIDPFDGDVINAYNDGPNTSGGQLGKFFELESSSPAANLKPGESMVHIHRTFHFYAPPGRLNSIMRSAIGTRILDIFDRFEKDDR
jgi:hypothetical protein